jgi:hypothetical protein
MANFSLFLRLSQMAAFEKRRNFGNLSVAGMTDIGDEPPPFKPLGKGRSVSKQTFIFCAGNRRS